MKYYLPVGESRDNPVPRGGTLVLPDSELAITGFRKGRARRDMWGDLQSGNKVVVIRIKINYTGEALLKIPRHAFELVGSTNLVREPESPYRITTALPCFTRLCGPGTVSGDLIFQVATGEKDLMLLCSGQWFFAVSNDIRR